MSRKNSESQVKNHLLPPIWLQVAVLVLGFVAWQGVNSSLNIATAGDDTGELSATERLITIHDDNAEKTVITRATTVAKVLEQQNIEINDGDSINIETNTQLTEKKYDIQIRRARPVLIRDSGREVKIKTFETDPARIVLLAGVKTYPNDVIITTVANDPAKFVGLVVIVERHDFADILTEEQDIPFATETHRDITKDKDFHEINTVGKNGKKTVQIRVNVVDGREVSRDIIGETITEQPTTQVETVGIRGSAVATSPTENEAIAWQFFISNGFSRNQTAGIMGNLMQEHGFQTTGDGLAQWTGGRKAKLMSMENPESINTQLEFLMSELNGGYSRARDAVLAAGTVEQATIAFQNLYERCGLCAEGNRINFAYQILGRH